MVKINQLFRPTQLKPKFFVFVLFTLFLFTGLFGLQAHGETLGDRSQRVFDYAELLNEEEKEQLEGLIVEFRETTNMDFVFLTSEDTEYSSSDIVAEKIGMAFAEDFYDYNGFGSGEDNAGLIYFLDMSNRMPIIITTGVTIDYITDARLTYMFNNISLDLSIQKYYSSATRIISAATRFVAEGIPEGQYRYDVNTGEILTTPYHNKVLTIGEIGLSGFFAIILGLSVYSKVRGQYELRGSTYSYSVANNSQVDIKTKLDEYIRTSTIRMPRPTRTYGAGTGVPGLGSGTHTGSSGTSHGGGGGARF